MSNILQHPPQNGEVWTVEDDEVRLHSDKRTVKGPRPVLILMAPEQDISLLGIANVVPLSSSVKPDAVIIPIARAYEDITPGFTPDPNSCALLFFYQPIEIRFFRKYKGRIDQTTQVLLKSILQSKIVGLPEFDFEP